MDHKSPALTEKSPFWVLTIVIGCVLVALDALALGIRLRSRSLQGLSLCFNDYAVLLAWPFVAGMLVIGGLVVTRGGVGQHLVDVSPRGVTLLLKTIPAAGILWVTANTLIKISILHFYNATFGISNVFRNTVFTLAALVVCFGIGTILQEALLCRPFAKNWNPRLPGTCGSTSATILAEAIINMLLDITILSLPMPLLWGLQMTRRKKVKFTIIFGLGFIVCVVTILRIVFAAQFDVNDITYDYMKVSITTILEPVLGIILACLPMFPPAFKECLGGERKQDSHKVRSVSTIRLRSNGIKQSPEFPGLNDTYPLAGLDSSVTESKVNGSNSRASSFGVERSTESRFEANPESTIRIERGWEVRTDEAV